MNKDKPKFKDAYTALLALIALLGSIVLVAGCAEVADPAARSNRANYTLTVTASGDGSTATGYITDGLMATADGEGAISADAKQTESPRIAGALDPVSAGIMTLGNVATAGIGAYSAATAAKSASGDCADGSCGETASCPDGSCGE